MTSEEFVALCKSYGVHPSDALDNLELLLARKENDADLADYILATAFTAYRRRRGCIN